MTTESLDYLIFQFECAVEARTNNKDLSKAHLFDADHHRAKQALLTAARAAPERAVGVPDGWRRAVTRVLEVHFGVEREHFNNSEWSNGLDRLLTETTAAPASALVPSTGAVKVRDTGWLIELKGSTPSRATVNPNDPDDHWTADSTKAIRFARKADAQACIDWIGWTEAFPSEHIWDDGGVSALVPDPAAGEEER